MLVSCHRLCLLEPAASAFIITLKRQAFIIFEQVLKMPKINIPSGVAIEASH